ncbi:phosphoribosylanthranilate isomerase [Oceanithermus profundus DSM 14977]|uniref:N-(5'-phosphoribosyl)anthranilate isomerase n=1 Tax=Oceanithermus profundus (strain DSM 14977 / NBRC 100410 / VKM B-2274 / 506) TaxID=670487 RepID=E4UAE2_OCEP5|nr:phosphoribosylanthranilate isomerase [Oceanithermus profundus DSM 14977]
MEPVRAKVCGLTRAEDALAAERLGAWAVGFVFAPSKRRVTPEQAAAIGARLGPFVARVGVFVDAPPAEVLEVARRARLSAVQLHGEEPPEWAEALRRHLPVIKAVRLAGPPDPALVAYPADALLVDGPRPGSGEAYDWGWLEPLADHPRLIVAGGLTPERLPELFTRVCPYAVDVSSGVESAPGVKDEARMRAFLQRVRRGCG